MLEARGPIGNLFMFLCFVLKMLSVVERQPAAPSSDGSAQRQQLVFHIAIPFQQIPRKGNKPTQALEDWGWGAGGRWLGRLPTGFLTHT